MHLKGEDSNVLGSPSIYSVAFTSLSWLLPGASLRKLLQISHIYLCNALRKERVDSSSVLQMKS